MIGIIFIGDLLYCPYLKKYTDVLDAEKKQYEVLYWNREQEEEKYPENYFAYNGKSDLNKPPLSKLFDFFKYRKWLRKKIIRGRYGKIIVLSTLSGMLIGDVLLTKYSNRFIFDIRDYSYEHLKLFKFIEEKLIQKSFFTCISSKGFEAFLPKNYEYKIVHNFNGNELDDNSFFKKKVKTKPLQITWLGSIRYFEHQKKLLNLLANDKRFELIFHGVGPELNIFQKYCSDNNYENIKFTGKYNNKDKKQLLSETDILNNTYKTSKIMEVKYALSNKFYDGINFKIPQLVETNTFKSEIVEKNNLGISLSTLDKDFADKLYCYYHKIDEVEFNKNAKKLLNTIIEEDAEYVLAIKKFISL